MKLNRFFTLIGVTILALIMVSLNSFASQLPEDDFDLWGGCTIYGVGTEATVDGSTITTHNDDSGIADFRLWIIPELEHPEGATRDIVINSHDYVDYGNWPEVDYTIWEDTRSGAMIAG